MKQIEFAGTELQERRESLGLSRAVASAATHVPVVYIDALEQCDFSTLPAPTYVHGFIVSYCRYLGLTPEPFVEQYRLSVRTKGVGITGPTGSTPERKKNWLSEAVTWGTICALLLLGWLTYTVVVQPQADQADIRVEAGTVAVEPPAPFTDEY